MAKHGKAVEKKTLSDMVWSAVGVGIIVALGILLFAGMNQPFKAHSPQVGGQESVGNFNEEARVEPGRVKTADNTFECKGSTVKVDYLYVEDQTFVLEDDVRSAVWSNMCIQKEGADYMDDFELVMLVGPSGMGDSTMITASYVNKLRDGK